MSRRPAAAVGFAALLCAACNVDNPGATYSLGRVGSDTLPFVLREEGDCRYTLRGGDIVIRGNRRYVSSFDIAATCERGPAPAAPQLGTTGRVRIARDTAFFTDSLGNSNGFGLITADSLVVQGPVHRLVYLRSTER